MRIIKLSLKIFTGLSIICSIGAFVLYWVMELLSKINNEDIEAIILGFSFLAVLSVATAIQQIKEQK
jgi:DMSO reductase anchor subunit